MQAAIRHRKMRSLAASRRKFINEMKQLDKGRNEIVEFDAE